jgi:hypothetical protein
MLKVGIHLKKENIGQVGVYSSDYVAKPGPFPIT